jgi:hypothetical protein
MDCMMGRCRRAAAAAAEDVGEAGGEVLLPAAEEEDIVGDVLRGEAAGSWLLELVLLGVRCDVRGTC